MKLFNHFVSHPRRFNGFNSALTARDIRNVQAASVYEECVKAEYGMTPIEWYEEYHKYPVFGN